MQNNDGLAPGTENRVHTELIRQRFTYESAADSGRQTSDAFIPLHMNSGASELGRCPNCGESISSAWLLIRYETEDGETGIWAECPACETVVSPE
jgi:hypothetical protein